MERKMNNLKIRTALFQHNLKQWELAELMGIDESVFCRKMRKELSEDEQNRIVSLINKS